MRPPWEWIEADLQELITNQVQEHLSLDYKACGALAKEDRKKFDISKDVSALANSAGGVIVYGINETDHLPTSIDVGFDPTDITKEWLEQVINSNIQRRIDGIRINPVMLRSGRCAYIVYVPQSVHAPHMAKDHKYYKRFNFESVPMEDYEVRDVGRRSETPNLSIEMEIAHFHYPFVAVSARIVNMAPEPGFHAIIRIYIDPSVDILKADGMMKAPDHKIPIYGRLTPMQVLLVNWVSPPNLPIWQDEKQSISGSLIELGYPRGGNVRRIVWHVSAPRMGVRIGMYGLNEDAQGPQLAVLPFQP
jgi:hypothetical protein